MAITTSVVLYDPADASPEVRTLAGFLAGFLGPEAYTLDLRQSYRCCTGVGKHPLKPRSGPTTMSAGSAVSSSPTRSVTSAFLRCDLRNTLRWCGDPPFCSTSWRL